jgi:hypothetical protein
VYIGGRVHAADCSLNVGYAFQISLKKPRVSNLNFKGWNHLKLSEVGCRAISEHGRATPDANSLLPHLRWELEQVMTRVRPADLSGVEIAALLAVLAPAHCRVIGGPAARPSLPGFGVRSLHAAPELV